MISAKTHNGFIRATFRMTVLSIERVLFFTSDTLQAAPSKHVWGKRKRKQNIPSMFVWDLNHKPVLCTCVCNWTHLQDSQIQGEKTHTHTKKPPSPPPKKNPDTLLPAAQDTSDSLRSLVFYMLQLWCLRDIKCASVIWWAAKKTSSTDPDMISGDRLVFAQSDVSLAFPGSVNLLKSRWPRTC